MAPRLRPLLTPPNDGKQKENKLDLRVALKTGAGHPCPTSGKPSETETSCQIASGSSPTKNFGFWGERGITVKDYARALTVDAMRQISIIVN
jgi:hypothetical protein